MSATVSIVVPAFENAEYIEATMRSILAQTYPHLEVIVADHASGDDTWERLTTFADDPRVTLLRTPRGGGARANWNRVSEAATGEYVKLVCGDDLIDPRIVEKQVASFTEGVVLTATSRVIADASGRPVFRQRGLGRLAGRHSGPDAIRATVRAGTNLLGEPACVMMRRDALAAAGFWVEGEEYLIDEATYVSVLRHGDMVGLREPLATFRINAAQWSVRLADEQAAQARAFHRRLRRELPEVVRARDVGVGDVLATVNALGRRVIYAVLRRRLGRAALR
jgi:glycosyltransferase involved in cell wall biosynthesis